MEDSKSVPENRKRGVDQTTPPQIQDSPQYKIRSHLNDLRHHFIEVLKTPDFKNCQAADDIREGMKRMIDLYKDMIAESNKQETSNNPPRYSSPNISNGQKPVEHQRDVKPAVHSPQNGAPVELTGHTPQGTYIIGGSAFGWNFITFNTTQAVYYGRSKEDFRAANAPSAQGEDTNS